MEATYIIVPDALSSLKKNSSKVSWSKIQQYRYCKANWFATNYSGLEASKTFINDNRSLPGTLIQKLYEVYFNSRLYTLTAPQLELWLDVNLYWLYHVIKFSLEDQNHFGSLSPRDFFKVKTNHPTAQARIQHAINQGADANVFKGIQPKFFNPADLEGGSEGEFLELMRKVLRLNLPTFERITHGHHAKVFSEEFLQTTFMGKIQINGGADFIFNPNGNDNVARQDIRVGDGFAIWDGKYNYRPKLTEDQAYYTDPDQLFFYAWILLLKARKLPSEVGFIEWKSGEYFPFPTDMSRFEKLKSNVFAINSVTQKVTEGLMGTIHNSIPIEEVPGIEFSPSKTACQFCVIRKTCAAAKEAGISVESKPENGISDASL